MFRLSARQAGAAARATASQAARAGSTATHGIEVRPFHVLWHMCVEESTRNAVGSIACVRAAVRRDLCLSQHRFRAQNEKWVDTNVDSQQGEASFSEPMTADELAHSRATLERSFSSAPDEECGLPAKLRACVPPALHAQR